MTQFIRVSTLALIISIHSYSQTPPNPDFKLAFAEHTGQLRWRADGFKIIQTSAKQNGHEIGVRAQDAGGRLSFLGFLFLFPEQAPMTSEKCRDGIMGPEKKANSTLKVAESSGVPHAGALPLSVVSYTARAQDGDTYHMVRAFVAAGDTCGDLEFDAKKPISPQDPDIQKILSTYVLDEQYAPKFSDAFVYAQVLYASKMFKAAAPIFETALTKLTDDPGPFPSITIARRIATGQAGMSYGIAGDSKKARAIFEKGIAEDPDYAMYYYNLACADAEEKKLGDARVHLQAAFARKANMITGEAVPDPTKDDSFLPHKQNKDFWKFLEQLQASR